MYHYNDSTENCYFLVTFGFVALKDRHYNYETPGETRRESHS